MVVGSTHGQIGACVFGAVGPAGSSTAPGSSSARRSASAVAGPSQPQSSAPGFSEMLSDVPAIKYRCAGKLGPELLWNIRSPNVNWRARSRYGFVWSAGTYPRPSFAVEPGPVKPLAADVSKPSSLP